MGELFQKKAAKAAQSLKSKEVKTTAKAPDSTEALAEINKALGTVTIMHGAQELVYDVAGKSIAYVREALGPIMQVPKDAAAWVNNAAVQDESTLLLQNSVLEFIKPSGTKGLRGKELRQIVRCFFIA